MSDYWLGLMIGLWLGFPAGFVFYSLWQHRQ